MAHQHEYRPLSFSPNPAHPWVLLGCGLGHCVDTVRVCLLCQRDGHKRNHGRSHSPVSDPGLYDDAVFMLAEAAMDRSRRFFS